MTSAHQPHAPVVVIPMEREGGTKYIAPPLTARRGGAKQIEFMPVLMASGGHITRTTCVHDTNQPRYVVGKSSHVSSPIRRFHLEKPTKGLSACPTANGSNPTSYGASS